MEFSATFKTKDGGVRFVEETLGKLGLPEAKAEQAAANTRHAIKRILDGMKEDLYTITVNKTIFFTDISVEGEGERLILEDEEDVDSPELLYQKSFREIFTYKRIRGRNRISFVVSESEAKELATAASAMLLGILFGGLFRLLFSAEINEKLDYYVLSLLLGMFMNALKIIVGPVVFFSLACCVSRFKNLRILGRIAGKTMLLYLCTTLVAIGIGFGLFQALPVGDSSMAVCALEQETDEEAAEEYSEMLENYENADFSIRNLLAGIVPDNFERSFLELNLLQIIFLAIVVGIGIGRCGDSSEFLTTLIESINHLLMVITTLIVKFIPLAIFCAMAQLVMTVGMNALLTIVSFAGLVILGMLLMMVFYSIFLALVTGLNPLVFYRKFFSVMITAFATSSATAAMPASIACLKEMGLSEEVVSFTIPLGANINMDGSSMVFIMVVLFMSRIYGISLTWPMLLSTVVSIVFLALGSPTVAGADLVIIAVLLSQVGVPMEAIGLILGVDAIFDMIQAMSNSTGDAVVSVIVSKSEHMLDEEKFRS